MKRWAVVACWVVAGLGLLFFPVWVMLLFAPEMVTRATAGQMWDAYVHHVLMAHLTCLGVAALVAVLLIANRMQGPQFQPVQAPELGPDVEQSLRGKPPLGLGAKGRRADELRPDEPAT